MSPDDGSRGALCRFLRRDLGLLGRVSQTGPVTKTAFLVALVVLVFFCFFHVSITDNPTNRTV